jgi:hypothetical protein
LTEENRVVQEKRQQVIGMVAEARARIELAAERAGAIRAPEGTSEDPLMQGRAPERLTPERKRQALDEVVSEARTRVTQLIRGAREALSGGVVGATASEAGGTPVRPWQEGLSASDREAYPGMVEYLDSAERAFSVDLDELEAGEALPAAVVAERGAAAEEVASYEEGHADPAGVVPGRDRWSTLR